MSGETWDLSRNQPRRPAPEVHRPLLVDGIFPTIHLGGTSAESLLEGYTRAAEALREAKRELAACYPNGRDYIGRTRDLRTAVALWEMMDQKLEEFFKVIQEFQRRACDAVR